MPDADGGDSDGLCEIIIEDDNWKSTQFDPNELSKEVSKITLSFFEGDYKTIAILLCDDDKIRELNAKWRGFDKPTNVLSFEYPANSPILGDIALSYQTCAKEAHEQGKSLKNHFSHLLVHGILHLLGYDHIDDADAIEMEDLEKEILAKMGIEDPYLIIEAQNGK